MNDISKSRMISREKKALLILARISFAGFLMAWLGSGLATGEGAATKIAAQEQIVATVVKEDKTGESGIVWVRRVQETSEIRFGRIKDGRIVSDRLIFRSTLPLFSPDLDFDEFQNPWITWIEGAGGNFSVGVASLVPENAWIINGPYVASALTPKILAGGSRGTWVFWTGRDAARDEIFGCVLLGDIWSKPFRLNGESRYPHMNPSAGLDPNGCPWVFWSAYDGRAYEIFFSFWNGEAWSPEEKITDDPSANTSPSFAFVSGSTPLVVWRRSVGRAGALLARIKRGPAWGPEIEIASDRDGPLGPPRLAVTGDLLKVTWESGERTESLILSLRELIEKTDLAVSRGESPPVKAFSRDENQYTTFGDSITYAENQGYQPRLEPLLTQKYGSAKIWNEGMGGETTPDGLSRIDSAIAAHASRYLLLMEGTNDVIFLDISMDTAAFDLREMALRGLGSGMVPLLATIIPRNDSKWSDPVYQTRIFDLNAKIRQVAAGLNIPLVDQFDAFYTYPAADGGWPSLLLIDGVHPNASGYQLMAETWFKGLKSQKETITVLSPNGGESWQAGTTQAITWTTSGIVGDVLIEISTNGGTSYTTIVSAASNNGSYAWTIPNTPGSNCLVRINEAPDGAPSDVSDRPFTITPPKPKAPLDPVLDTRLDGTGTRKINSLSWKANAGNAGIPLKNYRLYRKLTTQGDGGFTLQAEIPPIALLYEDSSLEVKTKYAYRLTSLSQADIESDPSPTVVETRKFEFPPLNPAIRTAIMRILFYQEKQDTITFERNDLNDESEVSGFNLYRRYEGESDDRFVKLATLNSATLSYKDSGLLTTKTYVYALTTVYLDGRESRRSEIVTDR
ncbi:MAG: GDSL-type esterase/lipase family protein [Candidatus Aminicenantales bacterium]